MIALFFGLLWTLTFATAAIGHLNLFERSLRSNSHRPRNRLFDSLIYRIFLQLLLNAIRVHDAIREQLCQLLDTVELGFG